MTLSLGIGLGIGLARPASEVPANALRLNGIPITLNGAYLTKAS